jgi:hypothetical protein
MDVPEYIGETKFYRQHLRISYEFGRLLRERGVISIDEKMDDGRPLFLLSEEAIQKKYQHILDSTFLRPRDIIRFCNTILAHFKGRKLSTGSSSQRFDNTDVHGARVEYSDYFIKELDDEIHKHVPNYKDYLEILRSIGTWHFERKRFEDEFRARSSTDPGAALQHLFTFSILDFIGLEVVATAGLSTCSDIRNQSVDLTQRLLGFACTLV